MVEIGYMPVIGFQKVLILVCGSPIVDLGKILTNTVLYYPLELGQILKFGIMRGGSHGLRIGDSQHIAPSHLQDCVVVDLVGVDGEWSIDLPADWLP